jgi:hypothetical protein
MDSGVTLAFQPGSPPRWPPIPACRSADAVQWRTACEPGVHCPRWNPGSALETLKITWDGPEEASEPKRWRSKEAREIVAAVQRAGGQWSAPPTGI